MNRLAILTALALFTVTGFADEKSAIEGFKKDITALKTWTDETDKKVGENPLAGFNAIIEMAGKMKAVKTDELPADLKEPWTGLVASVDKMVALVSIFPKEPSEIEKFMTKKSSEDPKFMDDFSNKMQAIDTETKPTLEKLKAAADKYGIEGLDKIGPK
jgi:hypothetical protein